MVKLFSSSILLEHKTNFSQMKDLDAFLEDKGMQIEEFFDKSVIIRTFGNRKLDAEEFQSLLQEAQEAKQQHFVENNGPQKQKQPSLEELQDLIDSQSTVRRTLSRLFDSKFASLH